jgi:hypothetical protein
LSGKSAYERAASSQVEGLGLWEKTSAAGNTHFTGRFGGVRILVLNNRDRGNDGEPDWHVFSIDGEKPRNPPEAERGFGAPRRQPRHSAYRRVQPTDEGPPLDDDLGDLWPPERPG